MVYADNTLKLHKSLSISYSPQLQKKTLTHLLGENKFSSLFNLCCLHL